MSEPRLASKLLVTALIRRAEALGGFAAVLESGDPTAGSILLILGERGEKIALLERVLQASGAYVWQDMSGQAIDKSQEIEKIVQRRKKFDPDLWLIELDIPSPERFAAEMNAVG